MTKIYLPHKVPLKDVYKKVKHLAIVAHADDIELSAPQFIVNGLGGFFGIVMGDNKGGPIRPEYKKLSSDKIQKIREKEQERAAGIGKYNGVAFLRLASRDIKSISKKDKVVNMIYDLIKDMPFKSVCTHSLFDNHPTHVAVAQRVVLALKKLPLSKRPKAFYGMEVWGSLEWLPKKYRVVFDVSSSIVLIKKLLSVYKSQSYKGHRYDQALLTRLKANALFSETHGFSEKSALIYGMTLLPLLEKRGLSFEKYLQGIIKDFLKEKKNNL